MVSLPEILISASFHLSERSQVPSAEPQASVVASPSSGSSLDDGGSSWTCHTVAFVYLSIQLLGLWNYRRRVNEFAGYLLRLVSTYQPSFVTGVGSSKRCNGIHLQLLQELDAFHLRMNLSSE